MAKKAQNTMEAFGQFVTTLSALESLNVQREAIRSITAPELQKIDGERKERRQALVDICKKMPPVDATREINALCKAVRGADGAARQRMNKRRDLCVSILSKAHAEYDFVKEQGTIFCEYVGSPARREAKVLWATLERLADLDVINLDNLGLTVESIEVAVKAAETAPAYTESNVPYELSADTFDALAQIGQRISDLAARKAEGAR